MLLQQASHTKQTTKTTPRHNLRCRTNSGIGVVVNADYVANAVVAAVVAAVIDDVVGAADDDAAAAGDESQAAARDVVVAADTDDVVDVIVAE